MRRALPALLLLAGCGGRTALPEGTRPPCPPAAAGEVWSRAVGATDDDWSLERQPSLAVTAEGDLVIATAFVGAVDFGCEIERSRGARDVLLAKLDARGRLLWAKQLGGGDYLPTAARVAVDGAGRITLAAGAEQGSVDLEDTTLDGPLLLASFEPDGTLRWAQRALVVGADEPSTWTLAVSPGGRIALAGGYTLAQTLDFGAGPLPGAAVEGVSPFLAVWDAQGTLLGASRPGDEADAVVDQILLADDGTVLLGGFNGVNDFSVGGTTLLLAKVDDAGATLWSRTDAEPSPMAADGDGFLMVSFSALEPPSPDLTLTVTRRAYGDGAPTWSAQIPTTTPDDVAYETLRPIGVARAADGGLRVASNVFGRDNANVIVERAILLARLDGAASSYQRYDGSDGLTAFALDPTGHPILGGYALGPFTLGEAGEVGGTCALADCQDLYLARLPP